LKEKGVATGEGKYKDETRTQAIERAAGVGTAGAEDRAKAIEAVNQKEQQRVALIGKQHRDQLALLGSTKSIEESKLSAIKVGGRFYDKERVQQQEILGVSEDRLKEERSILKDLEEKLPKLTDEIKIAEQNLLISDQTDKVERSRLTVLENRVKVESVNVERAESNLRIAQSQVAIDKLRFGYFTGAVGVADQLNMKQLDQLNAQKEIEKVKAKMLTMENLGTATTDNKAYNELVWQKRLLENDKERNQAQIDLGKKYDVGIEKLKRTGELMQGHIELANMTRQPWLAVEYIQRQLSEVLMPNMNIEVAKLNELRSDERSGVTEIHEQQKKVKDAVLGVAKAADFVRREWSEMFTEIALNMPTGSYTMPTGPSGFAMHGAAFTPFARQQPQGKGSGTREQQLQQIFGQSGRAGFDQQLEKILSGSAMQMVDASDVQMDAANISLEAAQTIAKSIGGVPGGGGDGGGVGGGGGIISRVMGWLFGGSGGAGTASGGMPAGTRGVPASVVMHPDVPVSTTGSGGEGAIPSAITIAEKSARTTAEAAATYAENIAKQSQRFQKQREWSEDRPAQIEINKQFAKELHERFVKDAAESAAYFADFMAKRKPLEATVNLGSTSG